MPKSILFSQFDFVFKLLRQISLTTILAIGGLSVIFPAQVQAHRGAADEVDDCRIKVGFEYIHFSAYTPSISGSKTYCNKIPGVGETYLVFDYEGKKLRHVSIEYEITKEPEGTRVFFQKAAKILTGNVNQKVDFSQFGPGQYLAHVTVIDRDKKQDTHLPFEVGVELERSNTGLILLILIGAVLALFIFFKFKLQATKASD